MGYHHRRSKEPPTLADAPTGTCLIVFLTGGLASGLTAYAAPPLASSLYASLGNVVTLSLFIFTGAPVSGGHFNSAISMATFFAGLSTLPRSLLYIAAQCLGAIVAGCWLRLGLDDAFFPVVSHSSTSHCLTVIGPDIAPRISFPDALSIRPMYPEISSSS